MYNKKIFIVGAVACIVGFGGGVLYKTSPASVPSRESGQRIFQGNLNDPSSAARVQRGNNMVSGEVLSKDEGSLTLKTPDGGSKIVFLSASTTIMKSSAGSSEDIGIGEQIFITGTQNSDGSVSAQSIQLRPEFRMN